MRTSLAVVAFAALCVAALYQFLPVPDSAEAGPSQAPPGSAASPARGDDALAQLVAPAPRVSIPEVRAEEAGESPASGLDAVAAPGFDPLNASVGEIQARVLDPTVRDAERVELLVHLQYSDGRSPQVVEAMIELAGACGDAELRSDIWRAMDDCTLPALRDPLLFALQHDLSADVRSEAAESIGGFVEDPVVRAALEYAAANDPDPHVRKEAAGTLRD